jgi:tripartite motif-containing protein 71
MLGFVKSFRTRYPTYMALDRNGDLLVSECDLQGDSCSSLRVWKWAEILAGEESNAHRKSYDSGSAKLGACLGGIAIDFKCGLIIGSDTNDNCIHIFRYPDGSHVKTIGSCGVGNEQFDQPGSVAVDDNGNVLVHDSGNGRIQVFRVRDGAYVRSMCSKGSGPGQLHGKGGIAFDRRGNIVVADGGNHRVQIFRYRDGAHLMTFGSRGSGAGEFNRPLSVAVDAAGHIFVADSNNDRVQVLKFNFDAYFPSNSNLQHIRTIGKYGNDDGCFWKPTAVVIDDDRRHIIVCDNMNGRLQVFELNLP